MGKPKVTNNFSGGQRVSDSISYKVEYRLVGDVSWIDAGTTTVTNNAVANFRRIFKIPGLTPGRYQVRVTRVSPDPSATQVGDINLSNVDEIRNENIAYVNSALLAVHMLATDQISGAVPNISCIVTGKKVKIG